MITRPIIMALQAAVRRASREGATPEQIAEWTHYALTGPVPVRGGGRTALRGQPCPSCPRRMYKRTDCCSRCLQKRKAEDARLRREARRAERLAAHPKTSSVHPGRDMAWYETIAYGAGVLKMSDAAMGRELGVSRERIRQIRNKTGTPLRGRLSA